VNISERLEKTLLFSPPMVLGVPLAQRIRGMSTRHQVVALCLATTAAIVYISEEAQVQREAEQERRNGPPMQQQQEFGGEEEEPPRE
jgi:hypothetical protein